MDRKAKILNCFDATEELKITDKKYVEFTERLFEFLLEMDLGMEIPRNFLKNYIKKKLNVQLL